jgi:chromosomal replication initiation ATPase DnaA
MDQNLLHFPHKPNYSGENLIIGEFNRDALKWIESWPAWTPEITQVCIYGPKGSGKTHIAHIFGTKSKMPVLKGTEITQKSPFELEGLDPVIIDEADKIQNDTWLFSFINEIKAQNRKVLYLAQKPTSGWSDGLADTQSRLRAIFNQPIFEADDETLKQYFKKCFRDYGLDVDNKIIDYGFSRIERSFEKVQELVQSLNQISAKTKKPISLKVVREFFEGLSFN